MFIYFLIFQLLICFYEFSGKFSYLCIAYAFRFLIGKRI